MSEAKRYHIIISVDDDNAHYAAIDVTALPLRPRNPMVCELTVADLNRINNEQLDGRSTPGAVLGIMLGIAQDTPEPLHYLVVGFGFLRKKRPLRSEVIRRRQALISAPAGEPS